MSDEKAIKAFGDLLRGAAFACRDIGKALAYRLGVPYHEDRETERMLGHRLKEIDREEALKHGLLPTRQFRMPSGAILMTDAYPSVSSGAEQLTEEVWTRDHTPDSYNNVNEAMQKLPHGITGVYFHKVTMCLVLVNPMGEKIGVRSSVIITPVGLASESLRLGLLKKAASA